MKLTGRKLDTEVAQKVMGTPYACRCENLCRCHPRLPEFSKDIGLAMKVFDRMRELGHRWLINADDAGFHLRHVASVHHDLDRNEKTYTVDCPLGSGKTIEEFAEAICSAAVYWVEDPHPSDKR